MTIPTVTVASLKKYKNSVIGNPVAKLKLVRDEHFIATLIDCLNPPNIETPHSQSSKSSQDALRIEAAHVLASLSYGSEEALSTLLRANSHHAFLYAISQFTPADPPALRAAFSRALRALAASIADIIGPSLWGLKPDDSIIRNEAQGALEYLLQNESLDIYLPLLLISPPPNGPAAASSLITSVATSTAQMLSTAIRSTAHRRTVTEWLPPAERQREVKSRRGWEKTSVLAPNAPSPWVARQLVSLLGESDRERDSKLVEAVLSALAALAKENPPVANFLAKSSPDRDHPPPLTNILAFTKSRSIDVQIAACLCVTHILRASSSSSNTTLGPSGVGAGMGSMSGMGAETPQTKTKACFVLHHLVTDDATLCQLAFDRGCLEFVAALIKSINPPEPVSPEWEEDEPDSISCLREASLTLLASLSLFSDDIRRRITDHHLLLPSISRALRAKRHVGTRYAACQTVRALSRAVSVLRTNIVDSGLGMDVLNVVLGRDLGEDRRVLGAALAAVCNILTDFSPLRPIFLEEKLMPRLVEILKESDDPSLRLSALWAVKNLVRKTSTETKRDVMSHLGWGQLVDLLGDSDEDVREQAFNVVRNLAETEEGIAMVFREVGPQVLGRIGVALGSGNDNVVLQAAYVLANLSNGTHEQQDMILSYPRLLSALQTCLASKAEARRPAVSCILELVRGNPRRRKEMMEAGIVGTLKRLCECGSMHHYAPHSHHAYGHGHGAHLGLDEDRDVVQRARVALDWLEHGEGYVSGLG
ncbi:armadillo-type protein [Crassisporium funariophilum]|nr:armadillo-type protein [Crassisporium funariophilum]